MQRLVVLVLVLPLVACSTQRAGTLPEDTLQGIVEVFELEDGRLCHYVGDGVTPVFRGKRLNYSCAVEEEHQVGILGGWRPVRGGLEVERALVDRDLERWGLERLTPVPARAVELKLSDGTRCRSAGVGASLAFEGEHLSYTCGELGGELVALLGEPYPSRRGWTFQRAVIPHGEDGFRVRERQRVTMVQP